MRKQKTPQEKQEQADRICRMIMERKRPLDEESIRLSKLRQRVEKYTSQRDDLHAVIPREYGLVSEWMRHSENPDVVIETSIFPNRITA